MEAEPQPAEGEAVPCPRLHGIRDMRMGTSVFRAPAPGERRRRFAIDAGLALAKRMLSKKLVMTTV